VAHEHPHGHGETRWDDYGRLSRLLDPRRETWYPRAVILAALRADEGMTVADVGAGSGYMIQGLAVAVGEAGKVFAVDPSPAARLHLLERVREGPFPQVRVLEGTAESTGIPADSVDRVLWQAIYHELRDPAAAFREAVRILKPGGRLLVVDWEPQETEVGPPLSERVAREHAEEAGQAAGMTVAERITVSGAVWGLALHRP
jgi:ubiquinone/menaquinone biosynthesis C-methylase UbiE